MKYLYVMYMVIPLYIMLLMFLSADEDIPEDGNEKPSGIEKMFRKTASYLYKRFLKKNRFFLKSPSRRHVKDNLIRLNPEEDINNAVSIYYIKKISTMLVVIFMGSLLAILAGYSAGRDPGMNNQGEILRGGYDQGEKQIRLRASSEDGENLGDFLLNISEIEYTKEEAQRLYKQLLDSLSTTICGENTDLKHVKENLYLPDKVKGYPFEISWKSDNIDVLKSDGKTENDDISFKEDKVMLTANIKYKEFEWEHVFEVTVLPKDFTQDEVIYRKISKRITEAEENSKTKDRFLLPSETDGINLLWQEKYEDNSIVILIISIIAAISIFALGDKDLNKKVEDRRRGLILEYPAFVSRLVLYMGSGMSVRAILMRFSGEYKIQLKEGGKSSFLYEEITKSCRELESGVPELNVYEHLGIRCGCQQYARLVTLLAQNLKKGNSEMLKLLREESDKATLERMSYARKLGEEAGTKLLVPMIMMLLIVMVVIMVPAYLSF
ncbi:immunoglobulin-like domain-containing protein [Butyrivibrio sp. JL13D10]|uniref:immunoglobulin-like domain-containing protein n=1 Tax=Butyrivibrio sp. JL13D10 TaxID=3236815 RepID=UPI0038B43640